MCESCAWCLGDAALKRYHDEEWGNPLHDDRKHFEYLALETFQCGLSWKLVLQKREIFRACFDNFDYEKIAAYDDAMIARALATPGMLKNRAKAFAMVTNARAFIKIIDEFGAFDKYIWGFTGGKSRVYTSHGAAPVTRNALSDEIASDLKKRGFKFIGSITVYSYLQSCGIINDHSPACFRYIQILNSHPHIVLN